MMEMPAFARALRNRASSPKKGPGTITYAGEVTAMTSNIDQDGSIKDRAKNEELTRLLEQETRRAQQLEDEIESVQAEIQNEKEKVVQMTLQVADASSLFCAAVDERNEMSREIVKLNAEITELNSVRKAEEVNLDINAELPLLIAEKVELEKTLKSRTLPGIPAHKQKRTRIDWEDRLDEVIARITYLKRRV